MRIWGALLQLGLLFAITHAAGQTITRNDFRAASGYTLIAPVNTATSYLMDKEGRVVHQWRGNGAAALVVYLLPNGHLLRTGTVTSETFGLSAGSGGRIDEFSWDGSLVWTYTLSNDKYLRHHDVAPLPNGNVLVEAWEVHTVDEAIAAGRDPNRIAGGSFWAEAIFEVRPMRPSGGDVVWEWHAWDHLIQDFDRNKKNYGDVAAHAELMDINFGSQTPDWLHFNAIAYNANLDQVVVSSRTLSEIWVIDHGTSTAEAAGHSGGRSGKGGDILYRWGNPQTYRAGSASDQRLFDQHGVHWIADGLPGAGHLLVFDNGNARNYSTVDEIVPPVDDQGFYARAEGAAFRPAKAVWSYGEEAQPHFLSRVFGGGQRLPNGNTLICVSTANRLIEVTPEHEVVWEADIVDLPGGAGGGTFRAERYRVNYDGLRGTELFREEPDVVSLASMLAGPTAPASLACVRGEPGMLEGATVEVTDGSGTRLVAPLIAAAPGQIDFQIPANAAIGPARVTLRGGASGEQSTDIRIDGVAPALFSPNADGKGVGAVVAVHVDGHRQWREWAFTFDVASRRYLPKPLSLRSPDERVYLLLLGTGVRGAQSSAAVSIGGAAIPVTGFAAVPGLAGVDEVAVGPLPLSLAGRGEQQIVLTVDGASANRVSVAFR